MAGELDIPGLSSAQVVDRGGSGVVYRARHDAGGRDVAVKVLDQIVLDDAAASSFEEGFVVMADVTDDVSVVTVLAVGVLSVGYPYLVLDFIDGGSLASITHAGVLEPAVAAAVMTDVCAAVDRIHGAGFIHGDVTPHNVLLTSAGEVRLSGFGLAQHFGDGPHSAALSVSPAHAAPEVLVGHTRTPASDVWALASTLLEISTRTSPFGPLDTAGAELVSRSLGITEPDFSMAPVALQPVFAAALVRDPAGRCSAAHMARLLGSVAAAGVPFEPVPEAEPVVVGVPSIAISTTPSGDNQPIPKSAGIFSDAQAPPGRRRVLGVVAALVIVFGLFVVAVSTRESERNIDQVATGPGTNSTQQSSSVVTTPVETPPPPPPPLSSRPAATSAAPVSSSTVTTEEPHAAEDDEHDHPEAAVTAPPTTTADVDAASDTTTSTTPVTSTTADTSATTTTIGAGSSTTVASTSTTTSTTTAAVTTTTIAQTTTSTTAGGGTSTTVASSTTTVTPPSTTTSTTTTSTTGTTATTDATTTTEVTTAAVTTTTAAAATTTTAG